MNIYVVQAMCGNYDATEWVVKAFADRQAAEQFAEAAEKW